MASEKFSLKWNDFQDNIVSSFKDLRSGVAENLIKYIFPKLTIEQTLATAGSAKHLHK